MGPLEQAKSELIRQFETLVTTDQQPAIARLQTKMKLGVDLLAWMKGQLVYPQFYLRFRDEAKTVAAVGKVRYIIYVMKKRVGSLLLMIFARKSMPKLKLSW